MNRCGVHPGRRTHGAGVPVPRGLPWNDLQDPPANESATGISCLFPGSAVASQPPPSYPGAGGAGRRGPAIQEVLLEGSK